MLNKCKYHMYMLKCQMTDGVRWENLQGEKTQISIVRCLNDQKLHVEQTLQKKSEDRLSRGREGGGRET